MKLLGAKLLLAAALFFAPVANVYSQVAVDPALHVYSADAALNGTIRVSGSLTLAQQSAVWAESFRKVQPGVNFTMISTGSMTAIPDLLEGKVDISLLSRSITEEEIKQFEAKFGYLPTVLVPASEQIGIFVNKNNPLQTLTLSQLDGIFSKSPVRGAPSQLKTWGEIGVTGDLAGQPIAIQGRRDRTGLQLYFQQVVLRGADFGDGMAEHETNASAFEAVAKNPAAITFGNATNPNPDVKVLPIVFAENSPAIEPTSPTYPISRPLMFVVNCPPGKSINPLTKEFLKYVFSRDGQLDVVSRGLVPVTSVSALSSLEALGEHTEN